MSLLLQSALTILGYAALFYSFTLENVEHRIIYQCLCLALFAYTLMSRINGGKNE